MPEKLKTLVRFHLSHNLRILLEITLSLTITDLRICGTSAWNTSRRKISP